MNARSILFFALLLSNCQTYSMARLLTRAQSAFNKGVTNTRFTASRVKSAIVRDPLILVDVTAKATLLSLGFAFMKLQIEEYQSRARYYAIEKAFALKEENDRKETDLKRKNDPEGYYKEMRLKLENDRKQASIDMVKRLCPSCRTEGNLTWSEASLWNAVQSMGAAIKFYDPMALFLKNRDTQKVFDRVVALEREYKKKGYTTFVHGQPWDGQLVSKLYTDLWEIKNKQNVADFLFPRVPLRTPWLESTRYNLIANTGQSTISDRLKSQLLGHEEGTLFMNNALTGNWDCRGMSTQYYYASNRGARLFAYDKFIESAFSTVGYKELFQKYKKEIDELVVLHKKAQDLGNILLIAVPNNALSKWVYSGKFGAERLPGVIGSFFTSNVKALTETTFRAPQHVSGAYGCESSPEYIMILETLRPDSGVKVFNVNLPEIEQTPAYKEFEEKYNELLQKIKKESR